MLKSQINICKKYEKQGKKEKCRKDRKMLDKKLSFVINSKHFTVHKIYICIYYFKFNKYIMRMYVSIYGCPLPDACHREGSYDEDHQDDDQGGEHEGRQIIKQTHPTQGFGFYNIKYFYSVTV